MRILVTLALLGGFLCSQESTKTETGTKTNSSVTFSGPPRLSQITIPAGTKIPVTLKNTISTKSNHEGDPIYAQSTFPIVIDDKIVVPAGTYLQGRIGAIKPAGRIKNRAEVLIHFTTLIYPSGYTVLLPGALENAPGVNQASVKDKEGAIRADSNAGHKVGTVAPRSAEAGAVVGAWRPARLEEWLEAAWLAPRRELRLHC